MTILRTARLKSQYAATGYLRHNNGFAGAVLSNGLQRFVCLLQRKSVSHLSGEFVSPFAMVKNLERAMHVARLKSPTAGEVELLSRDGVRIHGNVAGIGVLAEHEISSAIAA